MVITIGQPEVDFAVDWAQQPKGALQMLGGGFIINVHGFRMSVTLGAGPDQSLTINVINATYLGLNPFGTVKNLARRYLLGLCQKLGAVFNATAVLYTSDMLIHLERPGIDFVSVTPVSAGISFEILVTPVPQKPVLAV